MKAEDLATAEALDVWELGDVAVELLTGQDALTFVTSKTGLTALYAPKKVHRSLLHVQLESSCS
jgi:hypothetical protein